jgi:hypothetical protein
MTAAHNTRRRARRERARARAVSDFILAQPDPRAFAALLSAAGVTSFRHAWLVLALSDGQADLAAALAFSSVRQLTAEYRRRQAATRVSLAYGRPIAPGPAA